MTLDDGPVAVLGSDGYTGWALTCHLLDRGYDVVGVDDFTRREKAAPSVTPIADHDDRARAANDQFDGQYSFTAFDIADYETLEGWLDDNRPEGIVNLAQIPAAPYSMISLDHAWETQQNNIEGALNLMWALRNLDRRDTHVVQLATMGEYGCYDDDTEILTEEQGWIPFAELTGDEKVATRSTDSREVEFKRPNSVHEYDFEGELYFQRNGRLDFRVTPNHRIFTQKHSGHEYKELRQEWPEDVEGQSRVYDIGFEWSGDSPDTINVEEVGDIPTDDWMAFMGWFLSEGCVPERADRPNNYKTQIRQRADADGIAAIEACMEVVADAIDTDLTVYEDGGAESGGLISAPMHRYVIHNKELATYLGQFGGAKEKHIPWSLKQLDTPHLEVLLQALIDGDGWHHNPEWDRDNYRYATVSRQLADDVQEVALKCGFGATVRWDDKKEIYIVNICQTPRVHVNHSDPTDGWESYEGKVYCVNVGGDGIIFVRRDGKPVWSGNTPDKPIPEGFLEDGRPAPKSPGSLYHSSKVNATVNTRFCSETWDLPVTEIYQGIVYGLPEFDDDRLLTRFDVDAVWGTVLNRFTAQAAIGEPLTVYGQGGQKRAMLPIDDCIRCLTLALENPPGPGVPGRHPYRAINQFDESYRVKELAEMVSSHTGAEIAHLENPRKEDDTEHFYEPEREVLDELGYEPSATVEEVFRRTYEVIKDHTDRIDVDELMPDVYWDDREGSVEAQPAPAED